MKGASPQQAKPEMSQGEIQNISERRFDFAPLSKIMSEVKNSFWKIDKRKQIFLQTRMK